jgi:hypothetical protein
MTSTSRSTVTGSGISGIQAGLFMSYQDFKTIDPEAIYMPWRPFPLRNGSLKMRPRGQKTTIIPRNAFPNKESEMMDRARRFYALPASEMEKYEIPMNGANLDVAKFPGGWTAKTDPQNPNKLGWTELPWQWTNNRWIVHEDVTWDAATNQFVKQSDQSVPALPEDLIPDGPEFPADADLRSEFVEYRDNTISYHTMWGGTLMTTVGKNDLTDTTYMETDWRAWAGYTTQQEQEEMTFRYHISEMTWQQPVPPENWDALRPTNEQQIYFQAAIEDLQDINRALVETQLPFRVRESPNRLDINILLYLEKAADILKRKYGKHVWTDKPIHITPIWGTSQNPITTMSAFWFASRAWWFMWQVYYNMTIIWRQWEILYKQFPWDDENPIGRIAASTNKKTVRLPLASQPNPALTSAVSSLWGTPSPNRIRLGIRTPASTKPASKMPKSSYPSAIASTGVTTTSAGNQTSMKMDAKIPLSKIPIFRGRNDEIIPWFTAVDRLANLDPTINLQLAKLVTLQFEGEAADWWNLLEDFEREDCLDNGWDRLKQYMELHWCTTEWWNELEDMAIDMKFRDAGHENESPLTYVTRKRQYLEYSLNGASNKNTIRRILKGAPPRWKEVIPRKDQESLDDFVTAIRRYLSELIQEWKKMQERRAPQIPNWKTRPQQRTRAAAIEELFEAYAFQQKNRTNPNRNRERGSNVNELPKYQGPPMDWKVSTGTPPFKHPNPSLRAGCRICKSRHHYTRDCPVRTKEKRPPSTEQIKTAAAELDSETPIMSYEDACAIYGEDESTEEVNQEDEEPEEEDLSEN